MNHELAWLRSNVRYPIYKRASQQIVLSDDLTEAQLKKLREARTDEDVEEMLRFNEYVDHVRSELSKNKRHSDADDGRMFNTAGGSIIGSMVGAGVGGLSQFALSGGKGAAVGLLSGGLLGALAGGVGGNLMND